MKYVSTFLPIALTITLAVDNASADTAGAATLICSTNVMTATYKKNGDVLRTSTYESDEALIIGEESIKAKNNLRFNHCVKDEFLMKCSGAYYATDETKPTHFLRLNRVSGELSIKVYTENDGRLVRYTNEVGVCKKATHKLF